MTPDPATTRFMQHLVDAQPRIYAYIMTLLPDPDAAHDVLQETSLALWQKMDEYDTQRDFVAWACGYARFKVLSHRRDASRDRLVFSDDMVDRLDAGALADAVDYDDRRGALDRCLAKLTDKQRDLILQRYRPDGSVTDIAEKSGRPVNTVSVSLSRIRKTLADCIRQSLAESASPDKPEDTP